MGQEVNRGFFSVSNQPLSLNAPETMLLFSLTPCYLMTVLMVCFSSTHGFQ